MPAGVFRRPGVIPLPGRFPPRHDLVYPVKPACTLVAGLVYARCYARHHADLPACLHMFGVLFTPGVITCTVRMCGIHADLPPARQPPWWRCGLTPGYGPAMGIMHAPSAMTYLRATRFMAEQPRQVLSPCRVCTLRYNALHARRMCRQQGVEPYDGHATANAVF